MRILLIEDHSSLRDMLLAHLRQIGYEADAAVDGASALVAARSIRYDAVVLDLGLPDIDGMEVLRQLRAEAATDIPVLILTARGHLEDRVGGLNAGADDYLLKPFDLMEFDARLRAVTRRSNRVNRVADAQSVPVRRFGDLQFDTASREASADGVVLGSTRRELSLLEALIEADGRTVPREMIESRLYGPGDPAAGPISGNALEAVVSRLRRHLAEAGSGVSIETLRGIGYRLTLRRARR